ncbi:MAG: hypothetical protein ACON4I_02445 [Candidatus Puniceispirillaceae bacterium]
MAAQIWNKDFNRPLFSKRAGNVEITAAVPARPMDDDSKGGRV